METLIICAMIAAILPYLAKAPLAFAMNREGRYDNNYPREQQARLTGFGARASAAHYNSFESLIIFSLAIALVLATNSVDKTVERLAMIYVAARVTYCLMYYFDQDKLRSLVWLVGLAAPLAMMWQCLP